MALYHSDLAGKKALFLDDLMQEFTCGIQ